MKRAQSHPAISGKKFRSVEIKKHSNGGGHAKTMEDYVKIYKYTPDILSNLRRGDIGSSQKLCFKTGEWNHNP